jgi:N-glycosylase/DNA lyase
MASGTAVGFNMGMNDGMNDRMNDGMNDGMYDRMNDGMDEGMNNGMDEGTVSAVENSDGTILIGPIRNFDPGHTFLCGQCFRWNRTESGDWLGLAGSRAIRLRWDGSCLMTFGTTAEEIRSFWIPYLDLDEDYDAWKQELSISDAVMAEAVEFGNGLRLLRQDPWETLITFLISQNNGIPRIRNIVDTLCRCFGEPIPFEGSTLHAFPAPDVLAGLSPCEMDVCRAGYRNAYLLKTSRQIQEGAVNLSLLSSLPYPAALECLLTLHGVGVKVAECTLLFSGIHRSAFPVDRWVLRVMGALYPDSGGTTESLRLYAQERWGHLAGLAQEYLFYYARAKKIGI